MRWIPLVALGVLSLLASCLRASSVQCDNGAVCPASLVCTEDPRSLCGPVDQVEACAGLGKQDFEECEFSSTEKGACTRGICIRCTDDLAGCRHDRWVPMTSPVGVDLLSTWVAGVGLAYAGGAEGTLLSYDGQRWSRVEAFPATTFDLTSISGSDPASVFVLTSDSRVFHFDGTSWSEISPVPTVPLKGLHSAAPGRVVAVGPLGVVMQFDGAAWTRVDLGQATSLNAVWVSPDADMFAVGNNSDVAHYTATDDMWSVTRPFTSPKLYGVWGTGAEDVYAVGQLAPAAPDNLFATILHRSGAGWSQVQAIQGSNLFTVWGSGSEDVYVGGVNGIIVHHDGTSWSRMETPAVAPEIRSIAGSSAANVFAVGGGGVIWHHTGAPE